MIEKRLFIGIILTFVCGFVMFFLYNRTIYYEEKVTLQKQMDSLLVILDNKLNEASDIALSSSLMLSKNPYIIDCLSQNNIAVCSSYLMEIKKIMQDNDIFKNMGVHLHASDYKSFVRLWDYENRAQENLRGFRHSLEKVKNTKKAVQGIEIGYYGILTRAIVPIYQQDKYIGSIETVVFPEKYTEFFKDLNIDFYILMDNKYLGIVNAINYSENLTLKNYTIVNQSTNGLDFINDMKFSGTGYLKYGNKYLLYAPIVDINKNDIGYYILMWNESY